MTWKNWATCSPSSCSSFIQSVEQAKLKPVQVAFWKECGHLSDDEVQALIDQWIDEADVVSEFLAIRRELLVLITAAKVTVYQPNM